MRIEAITRRKIVVELSPEDMDTLDITYEDLDYASVETRRVIWVILDRVRENTGCDIDPSGQLLIDAMPRPAGGCILFFTLHGSRAEPPNGGAPARVLRKQDQLISVFEFNGLDALLDCANAYHRSLKSKEERLFSSSELYQRSGMRYRLLVCPAQERSMVRQFFSEYAAFCGDDAFAAQHTREHWQRMQGSQSFEALGAATDRRLPAHRTAPTAFSPGNVYTSIDN